MSLALDLRREYILYHLWKSKIRVYLHLYLCNSKCRNNFVLVRFLVAHIRSSLQFPWTERESTGKILVGHRMGGEAEWQAPENKQEPMEVSQQETQPKTWHRNITHGHRHCCECSLRAPVSASPSLHSHLSLLEHPVGWARKQDWDYLTSLSFCCRQGPSLQDLPKMEFQLKGNEI